MIDVDLRPILEGEDFPITQSPVPDDADTVGFVAVRDTGFYLLGFIPVFPMNLRTCVDGIVKEARSMDADGIAAVSMVYQPTSFLNFSVVFVPDWFGSITLTGSAWRRRRSAN